MSYRIRQIDKQGFAENLVWLSRSERVWLFAERHRGAVMAGLMVAGLGAIVLGVMLWSHYQSEQDASALAHQAALASVERIGDDGQTANEALETAARLYGQILEEFPRTDSAQLAWYFLGNILTEQRDQAGAVDAYQQFINQAGVHPVLLGLGYQRLGAAHVANGEHEKGIHAYTQALGIPDALNKDQVLFELAKFEEHENRKDQAQTHYRQLLNEHPDSPFASEAALQVKSLEPPIEESEETAREAEPAQEERQDGNTNEQ